MGPKKNQPKNGFYFFMEDLRKKEERKGHRFANKKEVADFASPYWNKMTSEQKDKYTKIAQRHRYNSDLEDTTKKFTSLGVSYATQDAEMKELEEYTAIMKQTIRNIIHSLEFDTTLKTQRFYLCHVNYFYKTDSDVYSPAEIAFAEFNLGEGLLNTLHYFVDPGQIPLGLKFEAHDWSEKTHAIPIRGWTEGEKDYYKMFIAIMDFLTCNGTNPLPPIYTMPDSLNNNTCLSAVKSAMISLCEAADRDPDVMRVYPLPHFFFELRNKVVERSGEAPMPSLAIIENEIEKDVFASTKDLGCSYHEEKDRAIHCSLSIVTRWVYVICDHCCKFLGVDLQLGKHCSEDIDVEWSTKRESRNKKKTYSESSRASTSHDDSNGAAACSSSSWRLSPTEEKNILLRENAFMPTIIDHGKLKEQRALEMRQQEELLSQGSQIRPPHSFAIYGYMNSTADPMTASIDDSRDFPEIGQGPQRRGQSDSEQEEEQPQVGARRDDVSQTTKYWPALGRGRMK